MILHPEPWAPSRVPCRTIPRPVHGQGPHPRASPRVWALSVPQTRDPRLARSLDDGSQPATSLTGGCPRCRVAGAGRFCAPAGRGRPAPKGRAGSTRLRARGAWALPAPASADRSVARSSRTRHGGICRRLACRQRCPSMEGCCVGGSLAGVIDVWTGRPGGGDPACGDRGISGDPREAFNTHTRGPRLGKHRGSAPRCHRSPPVGWVGADHLSRTAIAAQRCGQDPPGDALRAGPASPSWMGRSAPATTQV